MPDHGYLVIADITGYTDYLSGSELEHAQDSLRSLLEVLIDNTRPPLVISRLEGDAVISYIPGGSLLQSQTLVTGLENAYVAFRQAQQRMRLNTTCTCMACKNIPNLNLKFLVHYGEFMLQDFGPYTELIGNDVNLIHRLMKNGITEAMRLRAYVAYTAAAVDALEIPAFTKTLVKHLQPDPHAGEIELRVQDLAAVWEAARETQSIKVDPEDALFIIEEDFPLEPGLLWDYLTSPEYRAILMNADGMSLEGLQNGRTSTGSVYICAHGDMQLRHAIVDWRPFEYYSYRFGGMVPGTSNLVTMYLHPVEGGTRVVGVCGKTMGDPDACITSDAVMLETIPDSVRAGCQALYQRVLGDLELGIISRARPVAIARDLIEQEVHESLTQASRG